MFGIEDIYEDIKNGMSIERLYKKYGGITIYITKVPPNYKEKIIQEFKGDNHAVLAHKYNVSTRTVYETIKEHRREKASTKKDKIEG